MHLMILRPFPFAIHPLAIAFLFGLIPFLRTSPAHAETQVTLRNGLRLNGGVIELAAISADAFGGGGRNGSGALPIWMIDDGLRRIFVHQHAMVESSQTLPDNRMEIPLWQPIAEGGNNVQSLGTILKRSPFNAYGRRVLNIQGPDGPIGAVQGATMVTPTYTRLETLKGTNLVWDMRMATNSIPRTELRAILEGQLTDANDAAARLELARFYRAMEYFDDAVREVDVAIKLAPDPSDLMIQRRGLIQEQSQMLLREALLREGAGQRQLAKRIIQDFPDTGVQETKIQLEDALKRITEDESLGKTICDRLAAQTKQLGEEIQGDLALLLEEMRANLNGDTLVRLDDYQRLSDDEKIPLESRVALGYGGWILGPSSGMQNLAVVRSLLAVRKKVAEYLAEPTAARRGGILADLLALEGAAPLYVARMIAYLPPPGPSPEEFASETVPGMFRIPVPLGDEGAPTEYVIQLPPEYNPLRRYPCIVAMAPPNRDLEWSIQWWAGPWGGPLSERYQMREGQATRHGYIVIAPKWNLGEIPVFQYTGREHRQVLASLRDAQRRFSIDSDRVFLAGHGEGSSAAWDIAGAHPDLWAGMIAVGGEPRKYVKHYHPNLKYVPTYFVFGELAGNPSPRVRSGDVFDRYMRVDFDCMVIGYRGRGDEDFYEDIHHMFEWMELRSHRRPNPPKDFEVGILRRGDYFFWGVEATELFDNVDLNPLLYDRASANEKELKRFDVSVVDSTTFKIKGAPAKQITVYLSPEMGLNMQERIQVLWGKRRKYVESGGSIEVMLEDARTRADRQHVYWERVDLP